MTLHEIKTGRVVLDQVCVATAMAQRLRGLLGRRALADGEGMFFPECRMIHTWFMQMRIDVVFLDEDGCVLDLAPNLAPWRMAFCRQPGGRNTLELAAGGAARLGIKIGAGLKLNE